MPRFDLETTFLGLSGDGEVTQMPVGPDFWPTMDRNPNMRATLVSFGTGEGDWPHWEMHPKGDEVLVLVEVTDVVFAVDSIPAIFAITEDPFIVLTSNVFAILGLRAMYFLLADFASRFTLLKYGLALVLMFIGAKMLVVEFVKIPVGLSLGVVTGILVVSVIASLLRKPAAEKLR